MPVIQLTSYVPCGQNGMPADSPAEHRARLKYLYISHFISTWNSRGFEFGAVLFLATIYPGTLLPTSTYALIRALAAITFSPAVGRYIDRGDRLQVVRFSVLGQRLAVASSCAAFFCLLLLRNDPLQVVSVALFTSVILLACIEKLCTIMNTIAVERDWVVVIADGDEGLLQEMNAQIRRIDLFCKLLSPLTIALLDGLSSVVAIGITLALNSTSVVPEYFLIACVYRKTPSMVINRTTNILDCRNESGSQSLWSTTKHSTSSLLAGFKSYARSHAFLPSLSLSVLYLTVLSFSGQMIVYLLSIDHPRLTGAHIGILRTIATMFEISSTFIAPLVIDRVGAVRAGIWSLCWQFLCLTPGVATLWSSTQGGQTLGTFLFITSVILSRLGLWSFDLTAQLLVQNSVDSSHRGSFSATEASLQNLFELGSFTMTIMWSNPDDFKYPAMISLAAVYLAAAFYARFVRVQRGHLLHMPSCCKPAHDYEVVDADENREELELQRQDDWYRWRW